MSEARDALVQALRETRMVAYDDGSGGHLFRARTPAEQADELIARGHLDFERHLRDVAESSPNLSVAMAIQFAEARARGDSPDLPNPNDAQALAHWARQQEVVVSLLPHKPINAIKELRALGSTIGVPIGLRQAKDAIDIIQASGAPGNPGVGVAPGRYEP